MPCTDYALSGARYFDKKDKDGTTEKSQQLMRKVKEILDYFQPEIWCLENPMTRIRILNPWLGEVKFKFNPYDFGDNYKKEYPNFELLATMCDAIWLTEKGQNETHLSYPISLYGWDCESVLIINGECCYEA